MPKRVVVLFACSTLICLTGRSQSGSPDQWIHPNPTSFQFEPSVAIHPSNHRTILVAVTARSNGISRIGWYYTTDGGNTWVGRDAPAGLA